jgi:hypothetical protein
MVCHSCAGGSCRLALASERLNDDATQWLVGSAPAQARCRTAREVKMIICERFAIWRVNEAVVISATNGKLGRT